MKEYHRLLLDIIDLLDLIGIIDLLQLIYNISYMIVEYYSLWTQRQKHRVSDSSLFSKIFTCFWAVIFVFRAGFSAAALLGLLLFLFLILFVVLFLETLLWTLNGILFPFFCFSVFLKKKHLTLTVKPETDPWHYDLLPRNLLEYESDGRVREWNQGPGNEEQWTSGRGTKITPTRRSTNMKPTAMWKLFAKGKVILEALSRLLRLRLLLLFLFPISVHATCPIPPGASIFVPTCSPISPSPPLPPFFLFFWGNSGKIRIENVPRIYFHINWLPWILLFPCQLPPCSHSLEEGVTRGQLYQ